MAQLVVRIRVSDLMSSPDGEVGPLVSEGEASKGGGEVSNIF